MAGSALATIFSAELVGISAKKIEVEVDLNVGLHAFNIVGLADKAVGEAKERVNSALKNSGVKPPNRENRKITVNLAPADVKKSGAQYDLAIALGYLLATKQIKEFDPRGKLFLGELALDGRVRPVHGVLNIAEMAAAHNFKSIFVPVENSVEAAVVPGLNIVPVSNLTQAIEILEERRIAEPFPPSAPAAAPANVPDFAHIKGQEQAKRCLVIAAAGGHNLLMVGPPGVGKSLLAQALLGILPDLSLSEAIQVTKIYSAAGLNPGGLIQARPLRAPHQTASLVSVVGGGSDPKPGEISLAHRGILFLDELPEFPKNILEGLRAPLEAGEVHVARAKNSFIFPAKFTLIAAMNPCPCGYFEDPEKECRCAAFEVIRYKKKISGPLLDRIDLQIRVGRVGLAELREKNAGEAQSPYWKKKIETARLAQRERFGRQGYETNSEMSSKDAGELIQLTPGAEKFLDGLNRGHMSPRGFYRLLKTGQTIADLEGAARVGEHHLAEAFSYRLKEI